MYKTKKPKEEDVHKDKKRKKKDKDRDPDEREIKKQKKENRAERLSSVDSRLSESSKKHRDEKSDDDEKIKSKNEDSEDAWEPTVKPSENKSKKVTSKSSKGTAPKKRRGRKASGSDGDANHSFWDVTSSLSGARHCFGHKCKKQAREGSKYCSDNCGMNLASLRIMQTLPDRIREWNMTPCEAEKRNRRELDSIRAKQETVKATLEQLNRDFRTLEELITRGKAQLIEEKDEDDEDDTSAAEMTVHCVTCGSDVQTRTAIRHMERCYNKIESQTSFASRFKTQIDDERMFCDFYNPKEGTYCKRLQVLCPEHNPDEKRVPRDDEVCGYPISKEVFGKPTEFCRSSKKACVAHYCWEKLRRAELDMERVKVKKFFFFKIQFKISARVTAMDEGGRTSRARATNSSGYV